MYSALDLSKYIINKCTVDGHPISNLQLQKILYYIQKEFLKNNVIAFHDIIEAWQFGPVVPNSYYNFCGFGAMHISLEYDNIISLAPDDKKTIDNIVDSKRNLDPWTLVNDTHKDGGAWSKIYNNGLGNHEPIPIELIREVG